MSDESVIAYLRTRAMVEPEPQLVARIMSAVDSAPPARSWFAAYVPAAAIAGAVAILVALAIVIGQRPDMGPEPTATAEVRAPSVAELRAAHAAAYAVLREAPGVEATITHSIHGELAGASWFTWRPNGDQVVIHRSDLDVVQSNWWLDPEGEPPARGENVTTTIFVLTGDRYFMTDGDAWVVMPRGDAPPAFSTLTALLDEAEGTSAVALGNEGDEVTMVRNDDGGTTWTTVGPYRDGTVITEFRFAPDGGLVSTSHELVGVTPRIDSYVPLGTSGRVEFTRLEVAEPIDAPDPDAPPDPHALGLPPDFPLGPGRAGR